MNFTDTTHYLFPHESKPGVENVLPWMDEVLNKVVTTPNVSAGGENLNQSQCPTESHIAIGTDNSTAAVASLKSLQDNFDTYDTDKSGALDFKELNAISAEDPAAQWALSRYGALTKVAGDSYAKSTGLSRIGTYIPDGATPIEFKDTIASLGGISKLDLSNALEMSDSAKMQQLLEASKSKESRSANWNLALSIGSTLATYPLFKLASKRSPVLGWVAAGLGAFGGFSEYLMYNGKKQGGNTDFLASEINSTRKAMGLDEITSRQNEKNAKDQKDLQDQQVEEQKEEAKTEEDKQNSEGETLESQVLNNQIRS